MELLKGNLYFITDEFFERVGDPYLKINYETSGHRRLLCAWQHVRDERLPFLLKIPGESRISS